MQPVRLLLPAVLLLALFSAASAQQPEIGDKTLVVWAAPADLDQQGGSALTIDHLDGTFDGIVFGELSPKRWMAGSNIFDRTQKDQQTYPEETAGPDEFVQLAIVYHDKTVTLYRNGQQYAAYAIEKPVVFAAPWVAMIGVRHIDCHSPSAFRGRIDDARIYDRALSVEQIQALRANEPAEPAPIAWWTFDSETPSDRTGQLADSMLLAGARIIDGSLVLAGPQDTFIASPAGWLAENLRSHFGLAGGADQSEFTQSQRALRKTLLTDPYRAAYHFVTPEGACMPFDPNGALYWNGMYHLWYIFQDQRGHCWGHASSHDLLHWRWHTPDLFPGPNDVDRGMFSGNCFVGKQGQAVMLYHGVSAGNCIATASDKDLDGWSKLPANPIIPNPADGSPESKLYRSWDPHGWLEGDTYYAIFGGDPATIFKAPELDQWKYVGPLLAHDMPDVDDFEDISCPDLFPLGNKHMLLCISHPRGCRYYLGRWENEQFIPESHHRMNWPGGTCFAPESLVDSQGRRIMWAWVLDRRPKNDFGWSGTMSLPRVLSLGDDGALRINPPKELEQLRNNGRKLDAFQVSAGNKTLLEGIRGDCLELNLLIDPGTARHFGLSVRCSPDGQEQTPILIDRDKNLLRIDMKGSSLDQPTYREFVMRDPNPAVETQDAPFELADGEKLNLRIFLDHSMLEVFAGGRQCVTQVIYPTREDSMGIEVFSTDGDIRVESAEAWEMAPTVPW